MSDSGRRGLPLLSGRPPSPDPSLSEGACRKCNKEFNMLFSRSRRCNHCGASSCFCLVHRMRGPSSSARLVTYLASEGNLQSFWLCATYYSAGYSYCHSCSDYQALMPRAGQDQSGYDPMHVCGFCIEFLTITAAGKAQLKAMPLSKLKKYVTAYNIKIDRAVEKDDLIDGILAAKGPDGCLSRANENFYRKYSVPNRASSSRSRGLFSRPSQGTGSNAPPRPATASYPEFARPDLAPDDPPPHSHSQPQSSSWRPPRGPPPPPQRPPQPQYTQPPPIPPRGNYPGASSYNYSSQQQNQHAHYSQTGAGYGYPGAAPNYNPHYNTGYNPNYTPYTPPPGAYPPPPHPPPGHDHYFAGQAGPPPPPPRETRPPPPPPNFNTHPNRSPGQPPRQTSASSPSSTPRARTTSSAPPPVPTLDELLEMTPDSIRALSISTLKSVLFANHVAVGQILEKSDLVNKVLVLVEDEKRERARAREAEELERIAREAEREERERERRENEERIQREREEHERERQQDRDAASASANVQDETSGGSSRPASPPKPAPKTEETAKPSAFAAAKSHAAAHLERTGLCVICQDEEANIAIVDCG
ncbi:hypothetical protein CVT24_002767 [Panaeolus cyanescens]|uniref:FYVE-type domain-containing protein n=1 Tax=Panaeolus cyanescens TaxID=181874 RepID=A0A409VNE0_9AGAR|nr:hypothetical protein CVT24_002767 [Panaeolus cyanescens]